MLELIKAEKIHHCDKRVSNSGKCAKLATKIVTLVNRTEKENPSAKVKNEHRCDQHSLSPTSCKIVLHSVKLNQSDSINRINEYLKTLIGKNITSKVHTAKELRVKYLKPELCGVMCFQEFSKKWKFVYHDQIIKIY